MKRAGITITIIVTVLAFLNSIGTDGSFGNEDQSDCVLSGIGRAITPVFAPMGIEQDEGAVGEEVGAGPVVFQRMRSQFTPQAAYAYLVFVLLHIPCVAAIAAAIREMGAGLGRLLAAYTGLVAWSLATLFYQLSTGPALFPIAIALGLLGVLATLLWILGRTVYRPAVLAGDA